MESLDKTVIGMLREDLAPEDLARLLGLFRADVAGAIGAIEAAMAAADSHALSRATHRLAGCAGSVGAVALEAKARRIMAEGLVAAPLLPTLKAEAAAATAALKAAIT